VAAVLAGMKEVSEYGLARARHLRGEIYEVRIAADTRIFRVLFAQETKFILLSLSGFPKATKKTPPAALDLAETRLADWRRRGRQRRSS
jgi:phage-related protein